MIDFNKKTKNLLQLSGWVLILVVWYLITEFQLVPVGILPHPFQKTYTSERIIPVIDSNGVKVTDSIGNVITTTEPYEQTKGVYLAFTELFNDYNLFSNIFYSVTINLGGYIEAVLAALILGFLIGLNPYLKTTFAPQIRAIRYIPLPSTTGIFMAMFGMSLIMKINFLGFGIFIYLLPTVIQRIEETDKVHLQTLQTLNANWYHRLTKVYFPSVLARVAPDIIVLVAISWTYIVIIEVINNVGGLGGLIASNAKNRSDIVYALLILIVTIGYLSDKLLKRAERGLFKWKYA